MTLGMLVFIVCVALAVSLAAPKEWTFWRKSALTAFISCAVIFATTILPEIQ